MYDTVKNFIAVAACVCMTACMNVPQEKHTSYETISLSKQSVTVPVAWSATLALQTAQADLRAAQAQENSAGMEYECNRNLFEKKIVSEYFLNSSKNDYDRAKAAVAQARAACRKDEIYRQQVETLTRAYEGTSELMRSGKAMYLEVLNAQNTLLDAQIGQAANIYCGMAGLINAYIALGGGTE